ncbi:OsmC family protein [Pseudonocardia ailaonensis]
MGRTHGYEIALRWTGDRTADYRSYSRGNEVTAPGKPVLVGSADPAFGGDASRWNPEELLVAALAQCHMLTYLALCARDGIVVTGYTDEASGTMEEEPGNTGRITEVVLRPSVTVADGAAVAKAEALHGVAGRECFLARSMAFPVRHRPVVSA